jgi:hypothetical protein
MKYILNNIDDGQISIMTSFRKKISNTFIFAGLCHKIIQYDQILLRYVHVISVVDDVNGYLKLRMICYKLCKNETCSLLCDKTPNEIIFKMVDYLYPLVIILRIQ